MANEFTYASSARPMQATSSFQDLLDAERQKTVAAIAAAPAQTAAAVGGLADARTGGNGGGGGNNAGESSGSGQSAGGMAQGRNAEHAGMALGAIGGFALGGFGGAVRGANIGGTIGNNLGLRSAERSHMSPEQQAIAKEAVAWGGMNSDDAGLGPGENASSMGAVNGADAQSDAYGGSGVGADSNNGGTNTSSNQGGGADGGPGQGDSGNFAKGGQIGLADIKAYTAGGPNGPGVDDGLVDSAVGDFILTAQRTKQIGADTLKALSEGRAEIVMLKGGK